MPLLFEFSFGSRVQKTKHGLVLAHITSELLLMGEVRAGEGRIDFRVGLVIRALRTRSFHRGVRVPPEPLNSTRLIRGGKTYF